MMKIYSKIKTIIQSKFKTFLGINKQQEMIDTLYFYMNSFVVDVTKIPPTLDVDLRIMQKCDALLLGILDKIFSKYELTYWLDFGTLLGAYRHGGFIPWDDDTDISMPREDYEKAIDVLINELDNNIFDVKLSNGRIGIGYKHDKTGVWCDIFPVDTYSTKEQFPKAVLELKDKIKKYRMFLVKNANLPYVKMQEERKRIISEDISNKSYKIIYHGRDFDHNHPNAFYDLKEIYPMSRIEFEGIMLCAPANIPLYLEKIYGKNFMSLPKGGILHHDEGRGALSTWAKRNNIDMHKELSFLKSVISQL